MTANTKRHFVTLEANIKKATDNLRDAQTGDKFFGLKKREVNAYKIAGVENRCNLGIIETTDEGGTYYTIEFKGAL